MTRVAISGTGFTTSGLNSVDWVQVNLSETPGGVVTTSIIVYVPGSADYAMNEPGTVFNSFTDTLIDFNDIRFGSRFAAVVRIRNAASVEVAAFDLSPDQPAFAGAYPSVSNGYSPAANSFVLDGAGFGTAPAGQLDNVTLVFAAPNDDGRFLASYFKPGGTTNNAAVTVTEWSDIRISITDTRFGSLAANPLYDQDMPFVVIGVLLSDASGANYYYRPVTLTNSFAVDGSGDLTP